MAAAVILLSYFKDTVKNERQVEKKLDTKLYAVIPHEKKRKRKALLVTDLTSSFGFREAYNKLRSRVEREYARKGFKVFAISSPLENEGKKPDESLIGKRARVEKPVDNFSADGTVICEGSTYLAESEDDTVLPTDTVVSIIGCCDGKVLCRPYNKTANNNSYNSEEEASWRS